MSRAASSVGRRRNSLLASFTLVELLTVIAIIAILAALTLGAASGVWTKVARSRATADIKGISTALENYKADNGGYPTSSSLLTNTYANTDGSSAGLYRSSSQVLYQALSGQTNFTDNPATAGKPYMSFKKNQVGSPTSSTYLQDPWNYSYAYSTGNPANYPYSGAGFFDLWTTGGSLVGTANFTNTWISNWQ